VVGEETGSVVFGAAPSTLHISKLRQRQWRG